MKTFLRAASSPNLFEDPSVLDSVITTDGWQTLMTFTREMAREYPFIFGPTTVVSDTAPASRPTASAPTAGGPSAMDEDIPPELYEQFARDEGAGAAAGGGGAGIRICPHCTFENTHSGTDCEICGLPL